MRLTVLPHTFSICQVSSLAPEDLAADFVFAAKTDEELSLVCPSDAVPENAMRRDDGWRAFRIDGVLDFSLVGILAKISAVLAEAKIGIFAVSTFNTDYVLVKAENLARALEALASAGYEVK